MPRRDRMNDQTERVMVVESDEGLNATLVAVLSESGYEVSTDYRGGMKAVLAFEADLVILGADPHPTAEQTGRRRT